jgi:nucleoside-diphosphate-sugar epimerase
MAALAETALPDGTIYTPKNIMITGGAGFIASHVCILLAKKYPQFNIINYDRLDCKSHVLGTAVCDTRTCLHALMHRTCH